MENETIFNSLMNYLDIVEVVRLFSALSHRTRSNLDLLEPARVSGAAENIVEEVKRLLLLGTKMRELKCVILNSVFANSETCNTAGVNGDCLLHIFCKKGCCDIVLMLLRYGADPNRPGAANMTPLHCAAFGKSMEVTLLLLRAGANPIARDDMHRLPEDWAVVQQQHALNKLLRRYRKGKICLDNV